ncbi:flagellin FlaB [Methanocalculus sp. AMF5]|uniref:archaellin/type IV pilin N-terminal domain-containing protein n=1 Tax=Methanocalculus sp. AMF5 TaxID=1198257 RepID=UPI00209D9299|nr:archaellin/type IV pilin N-terminal domain-containing protein [Methanocalculus sp. AMF5]MCP1661924.1 flagellin FlaB [Methanocalculus sp. AMF5]
MSLKRKEDAFTGLEAAIVLIAFIVVAAVFSYVMLGAGFFTTQKSQETVFGAVGTATANMEVSGPIVIETGVGPNDVTNITFTVVLAAGGAPMDTSRFTYIASNATKYHEFGSDKVNLTWYSGGVELEGDDAKTFLERGDILDITINKEYNSAVDIVWPNSPFTIEVKPPVGASLPISRHAPLSLPKDRIFEVY